MKRALRRVCGWLGHFEDVLEPVCVICQAHLDEDYRPRIREVAVWAASSRRVLALGPGTSPAAAGGTWHPRHTAY